MNTTGFLAENHTCLKDVETLNVVDLKAPQAPRTKSVPIVRVVENVRSLPQKISIVSLEEPEDDILTDAYRTMVMEVAEEALAKRMKELSTEESDFDIVGNDPEVGQLIDAVINESGEYMGPTRVSPDSTILHLEGEAFLINDDEDITFDNDVPAAPAVEPMKDTPAVKGRTVVITSNKVEEREPFNEANKQAAEKGTLKYLKNVEGRVLSIMEAAFPNEGQREAVKSLIKKEFRREMSRVNNRPDGD
jgi:hypothetical protein